jgi:hypothetical protein
MRDVLVIEDARILVILDQVDGQCRDLGDHDPTQGVGHAGVGFGQYEGYEMGSDGEYFHLGKALLGHVSMWLPQEDSQFVCFRWGGVVSDLWLCSSNNNIIDGCRITYLLIMCCVSDENRMLCATVEPTRDIEVFICGSSYDYTDDMRCSRFE